MLRPRRAGSRPRNCSRAPARPRGDPEFPVPPARTAPVPRETAPHRASEPAAPAGGSARLCPHPNCRAWSRAGLRPSSWSSHGHVARGSVWMQRTWSGLAHGGSLCTDPQRGSRVRLRAVVHPHLGRFHVKPARVLCLPTSKPISRRQRRCASAPGQTTRTAPPAGHCRSAVRGESAWRHADRAGQTERRMLG